MQTKKKSFQIYFDNIPWLMAMSNEQLGMMMKQLFSYAGEVAEEPELTVEEVCETLPEDMEESTKMAFSFMAASVYRDTQKWWRTTRARFDREERKRGEAYPLPSPGGSCTFPLPEKYQKGTQGAWDSDFPRPLRTPTP